MSTCLLHHPQKGWEVDTDDACTCREPLRTWRAAAADPESGELTNKVHDLADGKSVEHGWWLTPDSWGLGVSLDRDWNSNGFDGRITFLAIAGPFVWGLSLIQPPRAYRRSA